MPFFRFCDLPSEIRTLVYKECFSGTGLYVRDRFHPFSHDGSDIVIKSDGLALLRASKLTRQESLPIFKQSIDYVKADADGLSTIPPSNLTRVAKVYLTDPDFTLLDENLFPNLRLLVVAFRISSEEHDIDAAFNKEEACELVVKRATDSFSGSQVQIELRKRRCKKQLPFEVLLQVYGLVYVASNCRRVKLWPNIVVDWEEQELVEGWPPLPYGTYEQGSDDMSDDGYPWLL